MANSPDSGAATPPAKQRRGCRRLILLMTIGLLLLVLALSTGLPQKWVIQQALERKLGVHADFDFINTLDTVILHDVQITDPAQSLPLLQVEQIKATYRFIPENGRYIERFHLMRPEISWRITTAADRPPSGTTGEATNGFDPLPFIPEDIALHHAGLTVTSNGGQLQAKNVFLEANTLPWEACRARLWSDAFEFTFTPGTGLPEQQYTGTLDLSGQRDGAAMRGNAAVSLPDLIEVQGAWASEEQEDTYHYAAYLDTGWLAMPPGFSEFMAANGLPIAYAHIAFLEDSEIAGTLKPHPTISRLDIGAHVEALQVGPAEEPWYQGNLDLALRQLDDTLEVHCTPHAGPPITLAVTGSLQQPQITLPSTTWSRDAFQALLPAGYQSYLSPLSRLNTLTLSGTAWREPETFHSRFTIIPAFTKGTAQEIALTLEYPLDKPESSFSGTFKLNDKEADLYGDYTIAPADEIRLSAEFQNITTDTLLHTWLPELFPSDVHSILAGKVTMQRMDSTRYNGMLEAQCSDLSIKDVPVPLDSPLICTADFEVDPSLKQITLNSVRADSDIMIALSSQHGRYNWDTGHGTLNLDGMLDLSVIAPLLGMDDLWGEVNLNVPVAWTQYPNLHLPPFTLEYTSLGYSGLSLPYGESLWLKGNGTTSLDPFHLDLPALKATFGEDTSATATTLRFMQDEETDAPALSMQALSLESDLQPLVQKRYLDSVAGRGTLEAQDVAWKEAKLSYTATLDLHMEQAALPDQAGHTEEFQFNGSYTYHDGLQGKGTVTAALLEIYGITVTDISGEVLGKEALLLLDRLRASLYEGSLRGRAAIHYQEEAPRLAYALRLKDIQLEPLSSVFEPDETLLTGLLNGTVEATATATNLQKLDINLRSVEGFSINRELLEYLLELSREQWVGISQLDKAIQNVLGDVVQCPFDRATMKLGLDDGRISGTIRMESATLDLTIDIHADPKALLSALKSTRKI